MAAHPLDQIIVISNSRLHPCGAAQVTPNQDAESRHPPRQEASVQRASRAEPQSTAAKVSSMGSHHGRQSSPQSQ